MLYVFQMDIGQMLTFDMSLLMDTVGRLQVEICKTTGIAVDHQILLLSGGQSLKANQKVMTYGAGADTNPVFLFSKLAIESQDPPVIRSFIISKDAVASLKDRVVEAKKLRPSYDAVNLNAKIAVQMRDSSSNIYSYCKNEFQEQHLQHQGWAAVIANLEEIADALQRTEVKFCKVFHSFFPQKESHFTMLDGFGEVISLMGQIPLLNSLKDSNHDDGIDSKYKSSSEAVSVGGSFHATPTTLKEWICSQAQGQGIDCLHQKCEDDLNMFNEGMFDSYDKQVQDLLAVVRMDPNQMKELVGIERRLSELEKRLNEAKRIATSQNDMAQGFQKHQSKLGGLPDLSSILPDLCASHKQQLDQMLEGHQRIVALQNNFRNSKQEMSRNIHQRLGWVMHVETKIAKLDSELIFHIKTLKVLECNLDLLGQIKVAPRVYADLVVETSRRKTFSSKFAKWAVVLEDDANQLYEAETQRRKSFSLKHGEHFLLHTMFKGFEDKPPNVTAKVPRLQDDKLPEITVEDISWLKSSVPELEEPLSVIESSDEFPGDLPSTYPRDRNLPQAKRSQFDTKISQSQTPCIVTATEGPATPFTVPEAKTVSNSHVYAGKKDNNTATTTNHRLVDATPKGSKETQTSAILSSPVQDNNNKGVNKCVGTGLESDGDSHSQSKATVSGNNSGSKTADSKPVSSTDSSSAHTSSEFATADFYFEDSMPSPMIEGGTYGKGNKSSAKDDLVNQVREKAGVIEELNELLKQKDEEIMKLQNDVRSLKGENSEQMEFFSLIGPLEEEEEESETDAREVNPNNVLDMKVVESACCQTDSTVDDRVKDLEQKLEKLTSDLNQSQMSLTNAENNLKNVQENEQTLHKKNIFMIEQLQKDILAKDKDLLEMRADIEIKETELTKLKNSLNDSNTQRDKLQTNLDGSHKQLETLKARLKEFAGNVRQSVPFLKKDLESLKSSVKDHMTQLDVFKSSAISNMQTHISCVSSVVSDLDQEKQSLKSEVGKLEEELNKMREEREGEVSDLKSQIDSLKEQLVKQEETFAVKYSDQKKDFDCELHDMETKHALELELELDKCNADAKETIEEWERKCKEEEVKKSRLLKELEDVREQFEKDKEEMESMHRLALQDLQTKQEGVRAACEEEWRAKVEECNQQVSRLETEATATASVYQEKESTLDDLRRRLATQWEEKMEELKEKHLEQTQEYSKTIEDLQVNHAYKLTELKKSHDHERDLLQAEFDKYRDSDRTHTHTQTELMAEVISLTSSASDGMEELTLSKPAASADVDSGDRSRSCDQSQLDELSGQIQHANDTIKSLEETMSVVLAENDTLKERLRSQEESGWGVSQPEIDMTNYPNFMQNSSTGKSFIMMDKEKVPEQFLVVETEEAKLKDQKISQLEKRIMEMSVTSVSGKVSSQDKISFRGCEMGDLVLLCLDEKHDQYVVFTVGTNLHFLHSDSLDGLGLKAADEAKIRKPWILAEVLDKEYCLAKKPNNRFRVPQGTCFYRVKCQPWKCEIDLTRHKDRHGHHRHAGRGDNQGATGGASASSSKAKKGERKS